jgi:hypothetical protein
MVSLLEGVPLLTWPVVFWRAVFVFLLFQAENSFRTLELSYSSFHLLLPEILHVAQGDVAYMGDAQPVGLQDRVEEGRQS